MKVASSESLEIAGDLVRGGINRTALIDFVEKSGLSEGELYMARRGEVVRQPLQKTILDPSARLQSGKPIMSTEFYERLRKEGGITLEGDELRTFLGRTGGIIGTSGTDYVAIKDYAGLQRLHLEVESFDPKTGKTFMAGYTDIKYGRNAPVNKVYSTLGKGIARNFNERMRAEYLGRTEFGALPRELAKSAPGMLTGGGTVMKAPSYLAHQMITGMGLTIGEQDIDKLYKMVGRGIDVSDVFGAGFTEGQIGRKYLTGVAKNVMGVMRQRGVSAEAMGMVMAGFYRAGEKEKLGLGMGDVTDPKLGLSKDVLAVAAKGVGIGRTTVMSGPQAVLHGANEAGLEQRMFQQYHYQLRNMYGFSADEASDYMTALLARKTTAPAELDVLKQLITTQANLTGSRVEMMPDKPIVGVSEFINAGKNTESMDRFLKKYTGGFVLDLAETQGLNLEGASRMTAWARSKRMSRISFGGGELLDKMKGTMIKTAADKDKLIGGEYARALEHFAQNIERAIMSVGKSDEEVKRAQAQLQKFPEEMAEVFAGASNRILRGKVRGSGYATGIGARTNLLDTSPQALKRLQELKRIKGGRTAVLSHQAFVDSMRTFIGGARDEFLATGEISSVAKARRIAQREGGEKLKRFFLGMEGEGGRMGVTQFVRRDPSLGLAHIAEIESFRDPRELLSAGVREDLAFEEIKRSKRGGRALKRLARSFGVKEIKGFGQIREMGLDAEGSLRKGRRGKAVKRFFDKMAGDMDGFFGMQGGGTIGFIERTMDIHYANGRGEIKNADMGVAAAMGGDFDGDEYALYNPAGKNRMNKMRKASREAGQKLDEVRALRAVYSHEVGEGLKRFAQSQQAITSMEEIVAQGLRKELAATDVGPVDIALDRIRFGIMQAEGSDPTKLKLLAVTDVLEEAMTIKSKKLMRDSRLSEIMTKAVNLAAEGDVSAMQHIFENIAFRGNEAGITQAGSRVTGALLPEAGLDISLAMDEIRPTLVSALDRSRMTSAAEIKTVRSTMRLAQADTLKRLQGFERAYLQMNSFQAAAAGSDVETAAASVFGDILNRVQTAGRTLDKRALGPVALGLAGSLGLSYMMGSSGHSPDPLIMPGETVNPELKTRIASGNIFQQRQAPPSVDTLQRQGNPYSDLNDRVINSRTSYVGRSNAYSMRGEIVNMMGISNVANYLKSGGASGSVMINDTRRPITANYIDRMMDS
jgi:hypothetical protein